MLSSSQELHSRKYFSEWPSHWPQHTDTDAALRSEAGHSGDTCASSGQCHLWPSLTPVTPPQLPDVCRILMRLPTLTTLCLRPPQPWHWLARTVRSPPSCQARQSQAPRPARHNWPAPTLRHSVHLYTVCTHPVASQGQLSQTVHNIIIWLRKWRSRSRNNERTFLVSVSEESHTH